MNNAKANRNIWILTVAWCEVRNVIDFPSDNQSFKTDLKKKIQFKFNWKVFLFSLPSQSNSFIDLQAEFHVETLSDECFRMFPFSTIQCSVLQVETLSKRKLENRAEKTMTRYGYLSSGVNGCKFSCKYVSEQALGRPYSGFLFRNGTQHVTVREKIISGIISPYFH